MTDNHQIEAEVLGKLLLMQSVMATLPQRLILSFVVEGLSDIGLVGRVELLESNTTRVSNSFRHALRSNVSDYGVLIFDPPDRHHFQLFLDHIHNFLFMVVVILDERHQRSIIANYQKTLESQVEQRTQELLHRNEQLLAAQAATVTAFSALTEARHHETGNHILRTKSYVHLLAEALRDQPRFQAVLDGKTIQLYTNSAPLHDIGKVAIPDNILLKPAPLSTGEWVIMKGHCLIGHDTIIASARELCEGDDAYLTCAAEIAYCHHEHWDGKGYPRSLAGEAIPLSARLMAVADVYDALVSPRLYKRALPHEAALQEMLTEVGEHFDPEILACLVANSAQVRQIAHRLAD